MKARAPAVVIGHNIGFRFPDGSELFSGLEFAIRPGCHGLVGAEGSGKSTLARIIAGLSTATAGSITRTIPLDEILYFAPIADDAGTVADELGFGAKLDALSEIEGGSTESCYFEEIGDDWDFEGRALKGLRNSGLEGLTLETPLAELSPVERLRVRLTRIRLSKAQLLILDEPAAGLDERAKETLTRYLRGFRGTLIVASNDPFLLSKAENIWELSELGLRRYGGNHEFYRRSRQAEVAAARDRLAHAVHELEHRRDVAQEAMVRQLHRIEHGKSLADTGIPKVHRGNMKRKSQETLGRINGRHDRLVKEAEERVREAQEHERLVQLPD